MKVKTALIFYLLFVWGFLVVPKLLGILDWSWFIVFAPLWVPVASVAITAAMFFAWLLFEEWVDE